jgi:hypothetical protein
MLINLVKGMNFGRAYPALASIQIMVGIPRLATGDASTTIPVMSSEASFTASRTSAIIPCVESQGTQYGFQSLPST